MSNKNNNNTPMRHCSFCGRGEDTVNLLIPGQDGKTYICDDCIFVCSDFIEEQFGNDPSAEASEDSGLTIDTLPRPIDIKAMLDEHVIGQDNAKLALAVAVYNHYKRILTIDEANKRKKKKQCKKHCLLNIADMIIY